MLAGSEAIDGHAGSLTLKVGQSHSTVESGRVEIESGDGLNDGGHIIWLAVRDEDSLEVVRCVCCTDFHSNV